MCYANKMKNSAQKPIKKPKLTPNLRSTKSTWLTRLKGKTAKCNADIESSDSAAKHVLTRLKASQWDDAHLNSCSVYFGRLISEGKGLGT